MNQASAKEFIIQYCNRIKRDMLQTIEEMPNIDEHKILELMYEDLEFEYKEC